MSDPRPLFWTQTLAAALAVAFGLALGGCRNADSATLMAEARAYREQGDTKAAVIQLKNLVQQDARHSAARVMLGELYLDQGDPQSAEKQFERALALGADRPAVSLMLGRALIMQGQYERILSDIALAGTPALRATGMALHGNAMLGMNKIDPARALFDEALGLDPSAPAALLGLARIAMWERQPDQARALLARALAAHPADVDCLRYHADVLRAAGQGEAALAEQMKILARHPHNAQALVDIANIHTDAGRFAKARSMLAAARKVSGSSLGLAYSEAMLDFRENKLDVALEGVQRVLRAAPEHFPSILLAGSVHSALGEHQPAELHLRKFLQVYPGHAYAGKLLAGAHLGAQRADLALAVLRPLLEQHSGDVELLALAGEANLRARNYGAAAGYFEKASTKRPQAPALRTGLALSKMGVGDSARAVAELEHAARLDRHPERTGVLLVMSYLRAGMHDKALKAVQQMEAQGDNPLIQNLKGGMHLARHELGRARASFEQSLGLDPAYLPALANLAELDKLERKTAATEPRYLAALVKAPDSSALLEALAGVALAANRPAAAVKYMERAVASKPDALALSLRSASLYLRVGEAHKALVLARRLQAGNPGNTQALSLLGQAYVANHKLAQAADTYARWSALAPQAGLPQLRLAGVAIARNQPQAALAALNKALALEPGLLDARITLINVLVRQRLFAEALAAAVQVQKQHPGSAAGFKLEGDVHSAQGKHAAALASYERALAAAPGGAHLVQVAGALVKLGRAADADARIAAWFEQHPADVPTRLYYASSKLVRNDPKGAIPHFEAVLKADPGNLAALNDLAWSYQRTGVPRALELARRAHRIAPDNPAVLDTLGWIYLEQGQLPRALPLLKKASSLAPGAGEILFHYAQALARSGDRTAARRVLERALASGAPFNRRNEAAALLASL